MVSGWPVNLSKPQLNTLPSVVRKIVKWVPQHTFFIVSPFSDWIIWPDNNEQVNVIGTPRRRGSTKDKSILAMIF